MNASFRIFGLIWFFCLSVPLIAQKVNISNKDSVLHYAKKKQHAKVILHAEKWANQAKKKKYNTGEYGLALNFWGEALNRTRQYEDAERILSSAVDQLTKTYGRRDSSVAKALYNSGYNY